MDLLYMVPPIVILLAMLRWRRKRRSMAEDTKEFLADYYANKKPRGYP